MAEFCIMAEKKSAYTNMCMEYHATEIKPNYIARGTFHNHSYMLCHSQGHLFEWDDPVKMLKDKKLVPKYKTWRQDVGDWNPDDFLWTKHLKRGRNYRKLFTIIKKVASMCQKFVIATDTDPDNEGDVIGVENADGIGWGDRPLYRIRFQDVGDLPNAFDNMKSMRDPSNWKRYLSALTRSKWDFLSMPETRAATHFVKLAGYKIRVVNQGRLKSVIMDQVNNRINAHNNYVKKPYFEVRFRDSNGHVYSRKASYADNPNWRFNAKSDNSTDVQQAKVRAGQDMQQYHASKPANVKTVTKTQAPGSLLSLAGLGAKLNSEGYSPKAVQDTYQKMYEDQIVSYPRTDDKKITQDMFNELLPKANQIAKVVGVDPSLLTHRTLRKKHKTTHADHGANRPGPHVPSSLEALKRFGSAGPAIYETLAKNYLAILCEDYVYKRTTATLADYPGFKTSFSEPVKMNYKLVFDNGSKKKNDSTKPLGASAAPYLYQGANPRTPWPTTDWLYSFLEKKNVGTGATRQPTVVTLTSGRNKKMTMKRARLNLTRDGKICAVMATNTYISNTTVTAYLQKYMKNVEKLGTPESIQKTLNTAIMTDRHDRPIFKANVARLANLNIKKGDGRKTFPIKVGDKTYHLNRVFSHHVYTDDEVAKLRSGQSIEMHGIKTKYGKYYVKGHIAWSKYKGHDVLKFVVQDFHPDVEMVAMADNSGRKFKRVFCHHRFTDNEADKLRHGLTITMDNIKAKGNLWKVTGKVGAYTFANKQQFGFYPTKFAPMHPVERVKLPNGQSFKRVFAHHRFTDDECRALVQQKHIKITIKTRYGTEPVIGTVAQQQYKNKSYWGFEILKSLRPQKPQAVINGKKGGFKPYFAKKKLNPSQIKQLQTGGEIWVSRKSKKSSYSVPVKLKWQSFSKRVRGKKKRINYLGVDADFKRVKYNN